MLTRIAVYGCPLRFMGPVQLSDLFFPGGIPENFYPSVHFHPFKVVKHRLSHKESVCFDVRIIGTVPGQWNFLVKLFFGPNVVRDCTVTANILQQDGSICSDIIARPGLWSSQGINHKKLAECEAAERLASLVGMQNKLSFVRAPRPEKYDCFLL